MEEVKQPIKKEIRLTFYTKNDDDMRLYNHLITAQHPGREVKLLLNEYLFEKKEINQNIETTTNTDAIVNVLTVIANKLDKLDNLQIVQTPAEKDTHETNGAVQEISFTADVDPKDLDDIDF